MQWNFLHLPSQQGLEYPSVPGHEIEVGVDDKERTLQNSGFTDLAYGLDGCHTTENTISI